jgi:hypothetical protein
MNRQKKVFFACCSAEKELISRIYKDLKKLTTKRTNNPINKWANKFEQIVLKTRNTKPNKYVKKCSASSTIKKMQIKMTLRFHLTLVRMAIIKKANIKCW